MLASLISPQQVIVLLRFVNALLLDWRTRSLHVLVLYDWIAPDTPRLNDALLSILHDCQLNFLLVAHPAEETEDADGEDEDGDPAQDVDPE